MRCFSTSAAAACLGGILVAAAPKAARAAGVEHPDLGTVAVGRGGAYAADPDGGLALQYNPAGLARQTGWRATVDGTGAWQRLTFAPAGGGAPVAAGGAPFLAPAAVVSYGRALGPEKSWTLALGVTGPTAIGRQSYPATGAQRYALVSSDTTIAYWSVAAALAANRWVSSGLTFQLVQGTAHFTQAVWSGDAPGTDPAQDTVAHVDVSGHVPAVILGMTVRPSERVAIGLSLRPRLNFNASGTLTTDLPAAAAALGAHQDGTAASFTLPLPDVWRVGVLVRPRARWLVEADVVLERWSALRALVVQPHDITIVADNLGTQKTLPDFVFVKNFEDAMSVRLGGERELLPGRLTVRAGYLHETSAVPLASTSVDFPNWERDVASLGASFAIPRTPLTFDVAWAHHFLPARNVTDSRIQQIVTPCLPPGCTDPPPTVVGNGRYEAALDLLSVSLRAVLDARSNAP